MSKASNKISPEVRERAILMALDHERDYLYASLCENSNSDCGIKAAETMLSPTE